MRSERREARKAARGPPLTPVAATGGAKAPVKAARNPNPNVMLLCAAPALSAEAGAALIGYRSCEACSVPTDRPLRLEGEDERYAI